MARIVLDRSFEGSGFDGSPFAIEAGSDHVLQIASERASLVIAFEGEVGDLRIVDEFVPHFFLDTTVPGVAAAVRYTVVCKGGTGRLRIGRDGGGVHGDLAITVACRTYVAGIERDESEIRLDGAFHGGIRDP
jgi:hypothetical protein